MEDKVSRAGLLTIAIAVSALMLPLVPQAQDVVVQAAHRAQPVKPPPGFQSACDRYLWLCAEQVGGNDGVADEQLRGLAASVNRVVNRMVRQASDREVHGVAELWVLPEGGRGDCEDLALAKMYRLLRRGVPASRLSLAIGLDSRGDNHAVLLVRTDNGHLVLDSLTDRIVTVERTGYRMLAMQAADDRSIWRVMDSRTTAHLGAAAVVSQPPGGRRSALAGRTAPDR